MNHSSFLSVAFISSLALLLWHLSFDDALSIVVLTVLVTYFGILGFFFETNKPSLPPSASVASTGFGTKVTNIIGSKPFWTKGFPLKLPTFDIKRATGILKNSKIPNHAVFSFFLASCTTLLVCFLHACFSGSDSNSSVASLLLSVLLGSTAFCYSLHFQPLPTSDPSSISNAKKVDGPSQPHKPKAADAQGFGFQSKSPAASAKPIQTTRPNDSQRNPSAQPLITTQFSVRCPVATPQQHASNKKESEPTAKESKRIPKEIDGKSPKNTPSSLRGEGKLGETLLKKTASPVSDHPVSNQAPSPCRITCNDPKSPHQLKDRQAELSSLGSKKYRIKAWVEQVSRTNQDLDLLSTASILKAKIKLVNKTDKDAKRNKNKDKEKPKQEEINSEEKKQIKEKKKKETESAEPDKNSQQQDEGEKNKNKKVMEENREKTSMAEKQRSSPSKVSKEQVLTSSNGASGGGEQMKESATLDKLRPTSSQTKKDAGLLRDLAPKGNTNTTVSTHLDKQATVESCPPTPKQRGTTFPAPKLTKPSSPTKSNHGAESKNRARDTAEASGGTSSKAKESFVSIKNPNDGATNKSPTKKSQISIPGEHRQVSAKSTPKGSTIGSPQPEKNAGKASVLKPPSEKTSSSITNSAILAESSQIGIQATLAGNKGEKQKQLCSTKPCSSSQHQGASSPKVDLDSKPPTVDQLLKNAAKELVAEFPKLIPESAKEVKEHLNTIFTRKAADPKADCVKTSSVESGHKVHSTKSDTDPGCTKCSQGSNPFSSQGRQQQPHETADKQKQAETSKVQPSSSKSSKLEGQPHSNGADMKQGRHDNGSGHEGNDTCQNHNTEDPSCGKGPMKREEEKEKVDHVAEKLVRKFQQLWNEHGLDTLHIVGAENISMSERGGNDGFAAKTKASLRPPHDSPAPPTASKQQEDVGSSTSAHVEEKQARGSDAASDARLLELIAQLKS